MAMVLTHYGYSAVTPATINSNPNNFALYYPALLMGTINVNGVIAVRKTISVNGATAARKIKVIDATLATGHPVVVGMNAFGGTHFVALTSGSEGDYLMRDPYFMNGKDISFAFHIPSKRFTALQGPKSTVDARRKL